MTVNGQIETEFESIDFICSSFFNVTITISMAGVSSPFLLDYCTPHNSAVNEVTTSATTTTASGQPPGIEIHTYPVPWNMWEIKKNISPAVGIHVVGMGRRFN